MDLFLKILGAVFLVLIVLLLGGALYLRYRIRRTIGVLTEALDGVWIAPAPARIQLDPCDSLDWSHREEMERLTATLAERGFVDAGEYRCNLMFGLNLRALTQPEQGVACAIYEMEGVGLWVDFVTRYQEGGSLTVSNAPEGSEMDYPPEEVKIFTPSAAPLELYERLLAERREGPYQPINSDTFARVMEQAYADEMDWRNLRGYATEQEIRRLAVAGGEELTDETLEQMLGEYAAHAAEGLSEAVEERYLATCALSAAEWEEVRDRVVVVHDRLSPEQVCELVEDPLADWDDELGLAEEESDHGTYDSLKDMDRLGGRETVADLAARDLFRRFNEILPEARRFRVLGAVDEPLPAELWVAPGD